MAGIRFTEFPISREIGIIIMLKKYLLENELVETRGLPAHQMIQCHCHAHGLLCRVPPGKGNSSTDFLEKSPLEKSPLYRVGLAAEGRQSPKIKCFSCGLRNFPLVPGDLATRGNFSRKSVDNTVRTGAGGYRILDRFLLRPGYKKYSKITQLQTNIIIAGAKN